MSPRPGSGSSYPGKMTVMDNLLYFPALDDSETLRLWRSDGTQAGTRVVSSDKFEFLFRGLGVIPLLLHVVARQPPLFAQRCGR